MESGSEDPAISLAILKKTGGTNPMQLVFTSQPRSPRVSERDAWAQGIKDQISLLPVGTAPEELDFEEDESDDLKKLIGYKSESAYAAAEDKNVPSGTRPQNKPFLSSRFHLPWSSAPGKNILIASGAIVIIILLIAGAAFIYPGFLLPKTSVPLPPSTPVPTAVATTVPGTPTVLTTESTPAAVVTPVQTPMQPAIVSATQLQTDVPATGVWVKIVYDGQYTGTIRTGGRLVEVSGKGGRLYRVPAASTDTVEVSIQKPDTAGLPLTAEVYMSGMMVQRKTIITPKGTLVMIADLKVALDAGVPPAGTK